MACYEYQCHDCGAVQEIQSHPKHNDRPDSLSCVGCSGTAYRVFGAHVFTFRPYYDPSIEEHFSTAQQRDERFKEKGWTYDHFKYWRKPKPKSAFEDLTFDEVAWNIRNKEPVEVRYDLDPREPDSLIDESATVGDQEGFERLRD